MIPRNLPCEVCGGGPVTGVCAIPGIPYTAAYCRRCLEGNAHPWWALVALGMSCDGVKNLSDEAMNMVRCTCVRLGKTLEEYETEVSATLKHLEDNTGRD